MSKARELLRSVKNLAILRDLAKSGGGLNSVGDLVDNFIDSEAMGVCLQRFKALPGGAEMVEQRYPPFQPDIAALEQLPEGTLGHAYAGMIRRLNYDPDFFRPRDTSSEALWLTQRIATTHDIHHVIAGFNTQPAEESGGWRSPQTRLVVGLTLCSISSPPSKRYASCPLSWKPSATRLPMATASALKQHLW